MQEMCTMPGCLPREKRKLGKDRKDKRLQTKTSPILHLLQVNQALALLKTYNFSLQEDILMSFTKEGLQPMKLFVRLNCSLDNCPVIEIYVPVLL